jgi:hypothetical protein
MPVHRRAEKEGLPVLQGPGEYRSLSLMIPMSRCGQLVEHRDLMLEKQAGPAEGDP